MDEPLGALDRRLREEMQYEIRRIHRDLGVTVLYVTHDQQEAMVMSDRIAVFNGRAASSRSRPPEASLRGARARVRRPLHRREQPPARARRERSATTASARSRSTRRDRAALRVAPCGRPGDATTLSLRPERVAVTPKRGLYGNEVEAERSRTSSSSATTSALRVDRLRPTTSSSRSRTWWGTAPFIEGDRVTRRLDGDRLPGPGRPTTRRANDMTGGGRSRPGVPGTRTPVAHAARPRSRAVMFRGMFWRCCCGAALLPGRRLRPRSRHRP